VAGQQAKRIRTSGGGESWISNARDSDDHVLGEAGDFGFPAESHAVRSNTDLDVAHDQKLVGAGGQWCTDTELR